MMMRRNKKIKKNSMLKSSTWWAVALIVSIFIVAMGHYVLDSQCDQIAREIGKAERKLQALDSECARETARWDEMKIREKLEDRLTRFGLEMKYARHDQIVHVDADGRPQPRSRATIARAKSRMQTDVLVSTETTAKSRVSKRTARR